MPKQGADKDAEEAFNRIGMGAVANVLVLAMLDGLMRGEVLAGPRDPGAT